MSHLTVAELAKAANIKPERVLEFEAGNAAPTFRQLTLIAKKLDRPLGFFLAPPPHASDVPEAVDFRGRGEDDMPPNLVRELKRAEEHRDALLDLAGRPEKGLEVPRIEVKSTERVALQLRARFGLTEQFAPPESQTNQVFNFWRGLVEQHGVLVFQTTGVDLQVFRGLSIHHRWLPIIMLNGADATNAKVFTLFHEVAHLANRTSGVCILNDNVGEEVVANRFAAEFLMPTGAVLEALSGLRQDVEPAQAIARRFKVSELAAAVRLRTLDVISEDALEQIRQQSEATWLEVRARQRDSQGFVPAWRLRYRDLGPKYVGAVAAALEDRKIDLLDATYLLDARLPTVERMLDAYYQGGGEA